MKLQPYVAIVFLVMALSTTVRAQIAVISPRDGEQVCPRTEISGKIEGAVKAASNNELWIVVHPKLTDDCWVQSPISVKSDGTWTGYANFGESKPEHDGLPYELKVMTVSPRPKTGKGECWPASSWVSPVVTVTRRAAAQCPR